MQTLGNILWLVLAGVWLALGYAVAGLFLCITIIGIPFGIAAFKLAGLVLWPFGKAVARTDQGGCLEIVFNVLWLIVFGWELFLAHLVAGLILMITIVGIPFGIQAFKLSVVALWPFGTVLIDPDDVGTKLIHSVPADPTAR